ncbi:MAG: rhomboid family intramembrane serine protease [Oscillospiraceae bacterium]|jgi:hypothetical protein|nr:rhomboid family intramembrane serine protease [Oscillospiraceae bacterium]
MLFIAIGNISVFALDYLIPTGVSHLLWLYWPSVLSGEIWRLVTFVFIPPPGIIPLLTPLVIYFYYWLGRNLQSEWGRMKTTVFYLSGMLFVIVGSFIHEQLTPLSLLLITGSDLNLSLFLAVATLFPETQIRIYFVIPVKMKWLALVYAGLVVHSVIVSGSWLPLLPLGNYLLFFTPKLIKMVRRQSKYSKKALEFKTEVRRAKKTQGYLHKCAVCGVTDAERPDMEFRYCSLCSGYECYCAEHIKDHEHK